MGGVDASLLLTAGSAGVFGLRDVSLFEHRRGCRSGIGGDVNGQERSPRPGNPIVGWARRPV